MQWRCRERCCQGIAPNLRERAIEVLGKLRAALGDAAAAAGALGRVGLRDRRLQRLPPREGRLSRPPRLRLQEKFDVSGNHGRGKQFCRAY